VSGPRVDSGPVKHAGWQFYGWWGIVLPAFVIIWITNALSLAGLNVFDGQLIAELGVERGPLKFGDTIQLLVSGALAPVGGWLADRFGAARRRMYAIIPAIAFLCTAPFYVGAVTSSSLALSFVLFLVPTALGLVWLGPVLSSIQHVVPPNMRATASAVFLFINNLIGIGLGTVALGALSDALTAQFGGDALRYAILAGTVFYLVAATLFLLSAKRLERDWV